jgi:hypothetical protein
MVIQRRLFFREAPHDEPRDDQLELGSSANARVAGLRLRSKVPARADAHVGAFDFADVAPREFITRAVGRIAADRSRSKERGRGDAYVGAFDFADVARLGSRSPGIERSERGHRVCMLVSHNPDSGRGERRLESVVLSRIIDANVRANADRL